MPKTPDPLFAEIRVLRQMMGVSNPELAKKAKVDKSSLSYWECGQHSPHLDKARAVAEALGFDITLVAKGEESEECLSVLIRQADMDRDQAREERDRLVEVIARLMSLPPRRIAELYGAGYKQT